MFLIEVHCLATSLSERDLKKNVSDSSGRKIILAVALLSLLLKSLRSQAYYPFLYWWVLHVLSHCLQHTLVSANGFCLFVCFLNLIFK